MENLSAQKPRTNGYEHTMPFGAQLLPMGGVLFRLWAPVAERVELLLENGKGGNEFYPMNRLPGDWFAVIVSCAETGSLYRFRIDDKLLVPDPASRSQFEDVHGPSIVVDPTDFIWINNDWHGRPWEEAVIYEIHPGTFSPAGTFAGITERLDYLADLGVTAIELMPIADFPGKRNWGYDGALLFAPDTSYGSPSELKELIDTAHSHNIMVFLDIVYNHFGPEGNYLYVFAKDAFFTEKHHTPWGAAINYSGDKSRTVRDYFIHNALYWLEEYRFDGLRFDAVHTIYDDSHPDILTEIALAVRKGPGKKRFIHLVLENDSNEAHYLTRSHTNSPEYFVAQWNDDFHHACHVILTGEQTGYYVDYADNPIDHLGRCLTEGFGYQGERSIYRNQNSRGEKSKHLPPQAFVSFLQNHDQVGNRAFGDRLTTMVAESRLRIAVALTLLAPAPPLLFMGEEFGATTPFLFFCDFGPDLTSKVTEGRRLEFASFPEFSDPIVRATIPDPEKDETFQHSSLNWQESESEKGKRFLKLYKKLLTLRYLHISQRLSGIKKNQARYKRIGSETLQVSWVLADGARLHLIVNFGSEPSGLASPLKGDMIYSDPLFMGEAGMLRQSLPQSIVWLLDT